MKGLIKRLSVLILLIFSISAQVWAEHHYYAKVTAYPYPSGSGKVYVGKNATNNPSYNEESSDVTIDAGSSGGNVTFHLYAQAKEGYEFYCWSENTSGEPSSSTSSHWTAQFQASTSDGDTKEYTRYAVFKALPKFYFTATAVAGDGGTASASVNDMVYGEHWYSTSASTSATFIATPNLGYGFKGWSETSDGAIVNNSEHYSVPLTNNTAGSTFNKTLYAQFEPLPNPTNISANDVELVVGQADRTVTYNLTPTNQVYNYVVASGNSGIITVNPALVENSPNNTGTFTLHAISKGTTTLTLTAKKFDGTTACTTTVNVTVKEKCATPVISFTDNGDNATTTITCSTAGALIYYTTNGLEPNSTNGTLYTGPFTVLENQTVKAIGMGDLLLESDVASNSFNHNSGVFGQTVVLNDYEDHTWTYYSGVSSAVDGGNYNNNYAGKLYSPNPRNVKITYTANGGAVSISENQNVFIYYETLEESATVGEYKYQVISNPFSKRPTGKGFGGWEIVRGGDKIKGKANGQVLALDEEIVFENLPYPNVNCTSADIELKATWVDANVTYITSNPGSGQTYSFTGGTYETNFIVLKNVNYSRTMTISSPCTIMMVEPDGSADYRGSYSFSGNITPNNSGVTKIENAKWNPSGNIDAKGMNFTIGRGMTMGGTARMYGTNTATAVNQVVKIESGKLSSFYHYGAKPSSITQQIVVFGNDYDRANNDNTKLDITGVCKISSSLKLGLSDSKTMLCRTYSKSGKIMSGVSVGSASTDNVYYYAPDGSDTDYEGGCRYLEIQGGEWCCIAGGFDNFHASDDPAFTFRMKGGLVRGSVYGAGEFYGASGNRIYVLTGGQIKGWLAAGANGTKSSGGETDGTSFVYVGGDARIDSEGSNTVINKAVGGNVFGAGCGYGSSSSSGEMTNGTNVVVADNAYVERGVYGGGGYGFTTATSNIYVTGGIVAGVYQNAIPGGVFGGAQQNKGGNANIYMTAGTIQKGGLYGGSNSAGALSGAVKIVAVGGQVGTNAQSANIHGGGYGSSTSVAGNVDITLGDGNGNYPTVYGDVYGGSALGSVNNSTSNHTYITMNDGLIHGDIYGGGLGNNTTAANVNGNVSVTINKGVAENVFGCNNVNGKPSGTVAVTMTGGTINHCVYGGGNAAAYTGNPTVTISGGEVKESVFGAGLGNSATVAGNPMVTITNAATKIGGSVYGGGSNGSVTGSAAVSITDATVGGSVYGAGYGSATNVTASTTVSISGQAGIAGNIYGGGEAGDVGTTTSVTIEGSNLEVNYVYGAGKGSESNVGTSTAVNIVSGTVMGSVFGGAEEGTVNDGGSVNASNAAVVTLQNGLVKGSVYGGGENGTVAGRTVVNMSGGTIEGNLFGGALGAQGRVYVAGLKTINMMGGTVIGDVYGGSQQANDANDFVDAETAPFTETAATAFVNISGGRVVKNVYAGGFYGRIYGSVTLNVGLNAINNAPDNANNVNKGSAHAVAPVRLESSLYAGSDWGEFSAGEDFGVNNISGRSDIYVDGTGYDMAEELTGNYMIIMGSIFGAGTSSDAGIAGRRIYIRNYGQPVGTGNDFSGCTRSLYSIQRGNDVYLENTHITFLGQGDMTSFITTERYSIVNVDDLRLINGSSVDVNKPIHKLKKLQSLYLTGKTIYNAMGTDYNEVTLSSLLTYQNKFHINEGSYLNVKYEYDLEDPEHPGLMGWKYGELKGFFYTVTSSHSSFAYARPKNAVSSYCPNTYNNANDGGFVSYLPEKNTYSITGEFVETGGVQVPFTNQTPPSKDDVQYYRFWAFKEPGDNYREGVLVAKSDGSETKHYQVTTCEVELPAATGCYFKIRSIDWGMDVAGIDAAINVTKDNKWSYWNDEEFGVYPAHTLYEELDTINGIGQQIPAQLRLLDAAPNTVFGLAVSPMGSLKPDIVEMDGDEPAGTKSALVISGNTSTEHLATRRFMVDRENLTETPKLTFMLTYSNKVDRNAVLSSVNIVIDEYSCVNDELIGTTDVELVVNTETVIDQDFKIPGYALMYGKGDNGDVYNTKVVLPTFQMQPGSTFSTFKVVGIQTDLKEPLTGNELTLQPVSYFEEHEGTVNDIAVKYGTSLTYDNVQGWLTGYNLDDPDEHMYDVYDFVSGTPVELGKVDGRQHFGIAFDLYYNGKVMISPNDYHLGTITFTVEFDNYESGRPTQFDIVFDITERGAAINWYVDGVDGSNLYSGKFPNKAKKSLSGVFNASSYAPSDNIFIVNTVSIRDTHGTEWNGLQYGNNNVFVYRYPGGHQEEGNDTGTDVLPQFTGALVNVEQNFIMRGVTLDGMNEWSGKYHELLNPDYYHTLGEGEHGLTVTPSAPLIEISNGAEVQLYRSSLENNLNSTSDGGGAKVTNGSLSLNDGCNIIGNLVNDGRDGAGIYVSSAGVLNVSGEVRIENNTSDNQPNNVYLPTADQKINIDYQKGGLTGNSHIGITKTAFPENSGFTPIAFSETVDQAAEAYRRGYFFDDKGMYAVVYDPSNPDLGPNTLYFGQTWVTHTNAKPTGFALDNIDSDEDLAWVISMVNGFNGQTANPNLNVTITEDLNMSRYIWVPIGNSTHKFSGVFDGGGHQINGLVCSMSGLGAVGLLGYVDGANAEVKNVFAMDATLEAPDQNYMGSIAGVVSGGATVHSCEGALDLHTSNVNTVMGGLVGLLDGGNVHSCISAANLNGYLMGGLVGQTRNNASIKNSYAYAGVTYKGAGGHHIAGMVADNEGTVESCYIRLRDSYDLNEESFFVLADKNGGTVNQCYYADGVTEDYGLYNTGNAPSNCDVYFPGTHPYTYNENYNRVGNKTTGDYLLDILNDYAETNDMDTWFRSASDLNEDLPLLRFPNLASVSNVAGSPKFYYLNSLQAAFDKFGTETTNNVYVDVYGNSDVETTGSNTDSSKIKLAINEDAAVLQSDGSTLVASVGITLDNSAGSEGANPTNGDPDAIDWHMFSTSLQHAPLGINYTDNDQHDWWTQGHHADYSFYPDNSSYSGYFPGNTPVAQYDFYCYYEPQYHWINFKRNGNSHWHEDPNEENQHEWINYQYTGNDGEQHLGSEDNNESEFICGKGYLLSVNDETFLQANGMLNNGTVTYPDVTASSDKCHGLNLIGNPYQSYLDFKEFAVGNSGSGKIWSAPENAFYTLIDEDMKGYVTYHYDASWNEGGITASRYINMHQGFFVVTQGNATATFTNAMRNAKGCNTTFRGDDEEMPRFPLVNLILNEQNGNRDYTVIELGRPEAGGAKKIKTLRIGKAQIYAHYENEDYAIAFTKTGESSIPVRFSTDENATFTLNWNTQNGTFSYLHLLDNMTGMDIDCLATDEYVFTATPDDYESRFKLVFAYTGIDENEIEMPDSFAFFNGDELIVNGEGRLECIDLQGRRLFVTDVYGTQNHVTLPDYASGLYLLHLSNGKQTKVQKIVVK